MTTPDERGRSQETAFIRADDIPTWMLKLTPSRARKPIAAKLRLYQIEGRDMIGMWRATGADPNKQFKYWRRSKDGAKFIKDLGCASGVMVDHRTFVEKSRGKHKYW